ncbi:MAG: hypothetical protein HRT88_13100, partial [Lentisphaeraceae bacterium]|nr:hypothetical protein [Lentisphaeraceae bacterium]
ASLSIDLKDETANKTVTHHTRSDGVADKITISNPFDMNFKYFGTIKAVADVDFDAVLQVGNSGAFPSISTKFHYTNELANVTFGSTPSGSATQMGTQTIVFEDVKLDLGGFFTGTVGDVVKNIIKYLKPIKPFIDTLGEEVGILSEFGIGDYDGDGKVLIVEVMRFILEAQGKAAQGKALMSIYNVVNKVLTIGELINESGGTMQMNFGTYALVKKANDTEFQNVESAAGTPGLNDYKLGPMAFSGGGSGSQQKLMALTQEKSSSSKSGKSSGKNKSKLSAASGFKLPLLENPSSIIGLLTGKNVSLVEFRLIEDLIIEHSVTVPIAPPVNGEFGFEFGVHTNLIMGYDTRGFNHFKDSGFKDTGSIFDGFYFRDWSGKGAEDVPELSFDMTIKIGAFLGIDLGPVSLKAGINGKLKTEVRFNINNSKTGVDVTEDGKVYFDSLATVSPQCLIDMDGELKAIIELYFKAVLDLGFFDVTLLDINEELFNETIFEFNYTCEPPDYANRVGDAVIMHSQVGKEVETSISKVTKNGIDYISFQGNDGVELIEASGVSTIRFDGSSRSKKAKILVNTSKLKGYAIEIVGGSGDDIFEAIGEGAVTFRGGSGNDTFIGDFGDDTIYAGSGSNTIMAGAGANTIHGQTGTNTIIWQGNEDAGSGNVIIGGSGLDTVILEQVSTALAEDELIIGQQGKSLSSGNLSVGEFSIKSHTGLEALEINLEEGADRVIIYDQSQTGLNSVTIDLGRVDGQPQYDDVTEGGSSGSGAATGGELRKDTKMSVEKVPLDFSNPLAMLTAVPSYTIMVNMDDDAKSPKGERWVVDYNGYEYVYTVNASEGETATEVTRGIYNMLKSSGTLSQRVNLTLDGTSIGIKAQQVKPSYTPLDDNGNVVKAEDADKYKVSYGGKSKTFDEDDKEDAQEEFFDWLEDKRSDHQDDMEDLEDELKDLIEDHGSTSSKVKNKSKAIAAIKNSFDKNNPREVSGSRVMYDFILRGYHEGYSAKNEGGGETGPTTNTVITEEKNALADSSTDLVTVHGGSQGNTFKMDHGSVILDHTGANNGNVKYHFLGGTDAIVADEFVIEGGVGNDVFDIADAAVYTTILGHEGNDTVNLGDLSYTSLKRLTIDLGSGNDTIGKYGTTIQAEVIDIQMGTGDDIINLDGFTFNVTTSFDLHLGDDSDTATIGTINSPLTIIKTDNENDGYDDTLTIGTANSTSMTIDTYKGDDTVIIGTLENGSTGNQITTAAGDDTVTIGTITASNTTIDTNE